MAHFIVDIDAGLAIYYLFLGMVGLVLLMVLIGVLQEDVKKGKGIKCNNRGGR